MAKEKTKKRAGKDNGAEGTEEYTRGPGKLAWRVPNLKKKLKPEQVRQAEQLVKNHEYRVIQLAWYMAGLQRKAQKRENRLKYFKEGLAKLVGESQDGDHTQ